MSQSKTASKRLIALLSILLCLLVVSGCSEDDSTSNASDTATKTESVQKATKADKSKYSIAKKENVALLAKKKKLQQQADTLASQKEQIQSDEKKAQEQQAAAQKQQQKQQEEQKKQQEQQAQTANNTASQRSTQQNQSQSNTDMNTSDSGKIVGNVNSHIYHVPGQSGYRMNSKNAVYFNTEQDAINAGYRRALR